MSRETLVTLLSAATPTAMLALVALAAWLSTKVAGHITDKRYGAAVSLLAYGAAGVVADFAQHVVADLKDPAKPGTWTATVAASVRLTAVNELRKLYPFAVDVLTRSLGDPGKVDALLGTLLEKAVVDLKSKAPANAAAVIELAPPAIGGRETVAPSAPSPR